MGTSDNSDRTWLHSVAACNCLNHVHLLVADGADKNAKANEGFNPYDKALEKINYCQQIYINIR